MKDSLERLVKKACVGLNLVEYCVHFELNTCRVDPCQTFASIDLFYSSYWGAYSFFAENDREFIKLADDAGVQYEILSMGRTT